MFALTLSFILTILGLLNTNLLFLLYRLQILFLVPSLIVFLSLLGLLHNDNHDLFYLLHIQLNLLIFLNVLILILRFQYFFFHCVHQYYIFHQKFLYEKLNQLLHNDLLHITNLLYFFLFHKLQFFIV